LSLENISEGAIRQIAVERVEFSGFNYTNAVFRPFPAMEMSNINT
jgi:hypothetical protein